MPSAARRDLACRSSIARHERCHSRRQHVLDVEHYLDSRWPRSIAIAAPIVSVRPSRIRPRPHGKRSPAGVQRIVRD
jgi:hypothetical protein